MHNNKINYRDASTCAICKFSIYRGSDYFCIVDGSLSKLENFEKNEDFNAIWDWASIHRVHETKICNLFKKQME
jgi:hypothetical protein